MSDEIPVSDVLLEATEYLCKLGSNLRVRSENLKSKRISKEKLRNTHAVQKAADKILLICELSKKSLENVETGVTKILAVCGGNKNTLSSPSTSKTPPFKAKEKINYHYIEYKSRKLRILQKVSLKHYRSVQVMVTNMPPSMIDKYPVNYNCKLYRMRKGRDLVDKTCESDKSVSSLKDEKRQKMQSDDDDCHKSDDRNPEAFKKKSSEASAKETNSSKLKGHDGFTESEEEDKSSTKGKSNKLASLKRRKSVYHDDKDQSAIRTYSLSDSNDEIDNSRDKKHLSKSSKESYKSSVKRKDSIEFNSLTTKDTETSKAVKHETPAQKKFRNIRVIDDSSSNSGNDNSNNKKSEPKVGKETVNKINNPEITESTDNIAEISGDSDQDHKTKTKKSSPLSDSDEQGSENLPSGSTKVDKSNKDSATETEKPLLKCIDITKLLKPEVVKAVTGKSPMKAEVKKMESDSRNKDIKNNIKNKRLFNKRLEGDEENYWEEKRKEVSAFKPKKFQIKVLRLHEYSEQFLIQNSIKIITHKGKIVTEIGSDKNSIKNKNTSLDNANDNSAHEKKTTKVGDKSENLVQDGNTCITTEEGDKDGKIIKAKSALLDDSDSDKGGSQSSSPTTAMLEAERVRKSLLHDSDSSNEDWPGSSQDKHSSNKNETVKKKRSGCDKNDKKKSSTSASEKIKKTLLHDSDSDKNTQEEQILENCNAISKCNEGIDLKKANQKTNREKSDQNSSQETAEDISDASEKIKNALLHDSDSDKNSPEEQTKETTDAISKSDEGMELKESDKMSDQSISERDNVKESDAEISAASEEISNSLGNSDSDKNTQEKPNCVSKSDEDQNIRISDGEKSNKGSPKEGSDKNGSTPPKEAEKNDSISESKKHSDANDENGEKTPKQKRKRSESHTPQSKRKNIMESMHAKKMLLTYSSSSDTEDEELKNALKDIKNDLLQGSDDEPSKSLKSVCRKKLIASSSSEEDITQVINKSKKDKKKKSKKSKKDGKDEKSSGASISQVDGNMDENSSSSSKMGRSKTKASGSHNSDTQDSDKNIDGLTNMRSLNKSSRRRDSSSTSKTDETSSNRRKTRLPKAPAIKTDNLLEAESNSSNEESGHDGEDVEDVECTSSEDSDAKSQKDDDLPPVPISTLNGGGLQHLAKDDLLDESEASSSSNKSSEENKKDDETDEEKVKSKRRKALAISSDSEGGSRKKDRDVKLSDFEDSEADSSEPANKKNKRKKKDSDSDASGGSSDAGKKKRRRIKQLDDSDASGSESETEGQKRGRKNIRKVMGKDQLEEATKKAAREEKERVARIAERQKMYNNLQFDESGKPDEVVLDKVILDFDPETKEPLIQVDKGLVKKLKPHQANGIKFMWDACFESAKRIKKDKGSGCILAHCMGLGKTLQVVSLTHTLLTHSNLTKVNRVLVVCPLSTVLNWVNEFNMWLKHTETDYEVDVYELSRYKQNSERAFQLSQWYNGGGVCVLGYEMFRNLSADNPKKYRKKMLKSFQEALVDPGPDMVVCDEGHLLKNEKTSLSQSMNRVRTQRRIVLTGTPLQNNLKEYYCMVQFVKPNLLGKYNEYLNRFVNPITNGQYTDSTEHDIRVMKRRSHVLHKMLDGAVQRRDYGVLAPFLPPKHEYVLFITLTDVQTKLYQFYLDNYSRRPLAGKSSGFLFPDFQSLQRIWTHPLVLKYNSERYEIMQQKKRDKEEEEDSEGSLVDFIDDESTPDESSSESSSDDLSDASDDSRKKSKKKKNKKPKKDPKGGRRATRANPVEQDLDAPTLDDIMEVKHENPTEWWIKLVNDDELDDLRNSHKLVLLFDILRQCEAIGDKLLVFSQSLYSLDLIEHFLGKVDEATQDGRVDEKLGGHVGSWSPGIDYFRLDGSTSCENRSIWCKNFNREDNPRARLFLISTRAGGLGINLVAANRVVIFDVSWNPSHDVQSIFRVYRFGQKKPCYVYRFLAMGTMEEKIYERQVTKQAISKRVIDEQQIDRHYKENDLAELYTFEPKPPEPRPLPPLPKDRLFAEMLKDHDKLIYKYHEHDSLLENKEEETLTEEERKAAWEDFENEKNRPPPAPFPNVWPMQNGMAPAFMAQQQQQIAYAALATMLRKDMPNINENQIRDMLPLIYNANPALMQKMTEQMYKYAQPGMMNPMMNMGMNPAAAGMGGGTSGLQYEPPWQRQQQQQQQMRLQQMLQQQQNSMGAKYYAGGLGSRDPVAMALQQQQARAIMVGDTRGRPRGRPPQPRPPQTSQDVVNLDSD